MKSSRIFISYSRNDISFAKSIVSHLTEEVGVVPWIDLEGIISGDEFTNDIVEAIDQAEIVVFLLSHNSINSIFAKKEVQYAYNTHKRICPVLIDTKECISGWFLFMFGLTDCIDYFDSLERNKFFGNMRKLLHTETPPKKAQIGMSDVEAEMLSAGISVGASQHLPPEEIVSMYKDFLFRTPFDNWIVYFRIGSELAKQCKEVEGGNEFAILAYSRAFECTFEEKYQYMRARTLIMRGAVKRRIKDIKGALQDINAGKRMAEDLENNNTELELASYNLAIIAAMNNDYDESKLQLENLKHVCRAYMWKSYLDSILQAAPNFPISKFQEDNNK